MHPIKKHILISLILGLALGVAAYGVVDYGLNKNKQNSPQTSNHSQTKQPVIFEIGPHNHILGEYSSPLTLVVFNDFTCPYCKEYADNLETLEGQYSGQVRIVWKHFPLNVDYILPAVASECAYEQGSFWSYAHELYNHQGNYSQAELSDMADNLEIDMAQFSNCLESDKYDAKVRADYYKGIMSGVMGAPATFIHGEYIPGAIPLSRLKEIVETNN